jgi:pyrroloquinoline quinone biosynthesis protein D
VVQLVDGKVTVGEIVTTLKIKFPEADGIEADIIGMFAMALGKAWIRKLN